MVIECPKDITMSRLNIFVEPMRCNEHMNTMKGYLAIRHDVPREID